MTTLPARIALRLGALSGWRRWLAGMLLGALAAGTMAPLNIDILLPVAFTGLVWLVDGARSGRQAGFDGWRFGFGFFVPSLYWMTESMFVDIGQFWFMVPFSLFGLPALLGVFTGAAAWAARLVPGPGLARILGFAVSWTVAEWLRGHVLTGLPWALQGYMWCSNNGLLLGLMQPAAIFGIYGVSLLTVLIGMLPALARQGRVVAGPLAALALFVAILIPGDLRLASGADPVVAGKWLRIVQPDTPQGAEWTQADAIAALRHALVLGSKPAAQPLAAEIWPESAVDFIINQEPGLRATIGDIVPPGGEIFTGTIRTDGAGPAANEYNSLAVIDATGSLVATYDKFHLVPFGEYVPFRWILKFNQIVADRADFATGPGPRTLHLANLPPAGAIICYESIFPHAVADEADRPSWLVNVTNDAWFGTSTGPYQHFAMVRVRAIEEGMPVVRAANSGISGVIDPHGRVITSIGLGLSGFVDAPLPVALAPTPYGRWGDFMLLVLMAPLLATCILRSRQPR